MVGVEEFIGIAGHIAYVPLYSSNVLTHRPVLNSRALSWVDAAMLPQTKPMTANRIPTTVTMIISSKAVKPCRCFVIATLRLLQYLLVQDGSWGRTLVDRAI